MRFYHRLLEYADIANHWAEQYHLGWAIPQRWSEYCCDKMDEALGVYDDV